MNHPMHNQKGAVLVVALVMLLVIMLLAVSSTRESALEARMTGNFVAQQQQLNLADGATREGEAQMTAMVVPREPNANANGECADNAVYCFKAEAAQYAPTFGDCDTNASSRGVKASLLTTAAGDPRRLRWYAIPVPDDEGTAEDTEVLAGAQGLGIFRYEINTLMRDDSNGTCTILRTTTAKTFN